MDYLKIGLNKEFSIDEIISVHYFEYTSDYVFYGEKHDFWEFLYVDKGEINVTCGDNTIAMKRGQMVFHKPFEFHALSANGKNAPNLVVMSFVCDNPIMRFFENRLCNMDDNERSILGKILAEAQNAFLSPLDDPELKQLIKSLECPFGSEQLIGNYFIELLIMIVRSESHGAIMTKPSSIIHEAWQNEFINNISNYLEQNISNKITLDDICRDNLVSRSRLQKIFKERTDGGAMEYFGKLKIELAKDLIRQGHHNFTEISQILGYNSIHYFSRHFKKSAGMTPSEYSSSVKILVYNSQSEE